MNHVHCYYEFDGKRGTMAGCSVGPATPRLEVGDEIVLRGERFTAFPDLRGGFLVVATDLDGAQVAVIGDTADDLTERRELVGAGAQEGAR